MPKDTEMSRDLRGPALAEHVPYLNGHQHTPRFIIFEPYWFYMIVSGLLAGLVPILLYVAILGVVGACFEAMLWGYYFMRTGKYNAYPGLSAWVDVQIRRRLMGVGRNAGRLGRPY